MGYPDRLLYFFSMLCMRGVTTEAHQAQIDFAGKSQLHVHKLKRRLLNFFFTIFTFSFDTQVPLNPK